MNTDPEVGKRVEDKIDDLMAKLNSILPQVNTLTEKLACADADSVRAAFKRKEGSADGS